MTIRRLAGIVAAAALVAGTNGCGGSEDPINANESADSTVGSDRSQGQTPDSSESDSADGKSNDAPSKAPEFLCSWGMPKRTVTEGRRKDPRAAVEALVSDAVRVTDIAEVSKNKANVHVERAGQTGFYIVLRYGDATWGVVGGRGCGAAEGGSFDIESAATCDTKREEAEAAGKPLTPEEITKCLIGGTL